MIPNLSGVEAISAGDSCAFALQDDGKVASWGVNREGCVGDGSQSVRSAPVTLSLTNVVAIEARAPGVGTFVPYDPEVVIEEAQTP